MGMSRLNKKDRLLMKSCYYKFNMMDPEHFRGLANPPSNNPLPKTIGQQKSLQPHNRTKDPPIQHIYPKHQIYSDMQPYNHTFQHARNHNGKTFKRQNSSLHKEKTNCVSNKDFQSCGDACVKYNRQSGEYIGSKNRRQLKKGKDKKNLKWMSKLDKVKMLQKSKNYHPYLDRAKAEEESKIVKEIYSNQNSSRNGDDNINKYNKTYSSLHEHLRQLQAGKQISHDDSKQNQKQRNPEKGPIQQKRNIEAENFEIDKQLNIGIKTLLVIKNNKGKISRNGLTEFRKRNEQKKKIQPITYKCFLNDKKTLTKYNVLRAQRLEQKQRQKQKQKQEENIQSKSKIVETIINLEENNEDDQSQINISNLSILADNQDDCSFEEQFKERQDFQENFRKIHSSMDIGPFENQLQKENISFSKELKDQNVILTKQHSPENKDRDLKRKKLTKKQSVNQNKRIQQKQMRKQKERKDSIPAIREWMITSADSFRGWDYKVQNEEEPISFYPTNLRQTKKASSKSAGKRGRKRQNSEMTGEQELGIIQQNFLKIEEAIQEQQKPLSRRHSRKSSRRKLMTVLP